MSEIQKQLSAARASVDPKGAAAPHARAAQVRLRRDEDASEEAEIDTTGEVVPQESTSADEQPDRHDRSSALLAAGLGLLGIGGAAGLGGTSSNSGSKPAALIDPPKTDQPRSDPPVTEQKPGTGTSQPPQSGGESVSTPDQPKPDQPKPDPPKPDEPKTDQPKPDDPKTDPVKPGTDPSPPEDPPAKPVHVPDAPALALQKDTGSNDHDHITSSGLVNVSGLEAGASVAVSLDDGKTWTSGLASTLPESLFGEDGAKHLLVKQIDADGRESVVARLDFLLDRSAPAAPSWSMPAGKPALGAADVLALQGVEAGALVEYRLDASSSWQVAPDGKIPVSIFHADGFGQVEVRQTDLAGNIGPSAALVAKVDVTAPPAPTLTLVDATGISSANGITSSGKVRVGDLEPGATLQVNRGDRFVDMAVGSDGLLDLFADLAANGTPIQLRARQVDAAGNASAAAGLDFTLDNLAPHIGWSSSSQQAYWHGDFRVQARSPVDLQAGDVVTLNGYDSLEISPDPSGGPVIYRVDEGSWAVLPADRQVPLSAFRTDGRHTLQLNQVDVAGNQGSLKLTVSVDTKAPSTPTLALFNDNGSDTTDSVTSDGRVLISGAGLQGLEFQSRVNGGSWVDERLGSNEPRTYIGSGYEGLVTLEVRFIDAAGNLSATSTLSFTQTHAPI